MWGIVFNHDIIFFMHQKSTIFVSNYCLPDPLRQMVQIVSEYVQK